MSSTDTENTEPTETTTGAEQATAAHAHDELASADGADRSEDSAEAAEEPAEEPAKDTWKDPRNARIELLERMLAEREATLQSYIRAHKKSEQDLEAFKGRLERDRERELMQAKAKIVEKLLDVEDNLERTIDAAARGGTIEAFVEGARLVHRMFRERLGELGLERVDPAGQPFDPASMEALGMIPVQDADKDGTVVLTLRAGYRIGETEIRPALVQVGKFMS